MKTRFVKTPTGALPDDPKSREWYDKIKIGEVFTNESKKVRNPKFHRKFFALLNLAYDYWEPGELNSKYGTPEKNFDQFRRDLTILAGFFKIVIRLNGSTRVEPKSISFAKMDEFEFAKLYNKVLDVILKNIPVMCKLGKDEINRLVDQFIAFG